MPKWYVVWRGRAAGIFSTWAECEAQVKGFPGAQFKSYPSLAEAQAAFNQPQAPARRARPAPPADLPAGIAVDAACSGNPGPLEYRGVDTRAGAVIFWHGPLAEGTNNLGEFLAIVTAWRWLAERRDPRPVYSDSQIAMRWAQAGHCRTQLAPTPANAPLFARLAEAEAWLAAHPRRNPLLKWDTEQWGENPADFGRK